MKRVSLPINSKINLDRIEETSQASMESNSGSIEEDESLNYKFPADKTTVFKRKMDFKSIQDLKLLNKNQEANDLTRKTSRQSRGSFSEDGETINALNSKNSDAFTKKQNGHDMTFGTWSGSGLVDVPPKYIWIILVVIPFNKDQVEKISKVLEDIHMEFGLTKESEKRIKLEFIDIKRYVKWAYMKSADIFIEICTKDRLNLCSLEYSLLKKDAMMMIDSNTSLNSFLNESVSVENPLNVSRFTNKLVKLMNKVKKSSKIG